MTREELVREVALSINIVENKWMYPTEQHIKYATSAIDAIYDALSTPTKDMVSSYNNDGTHLFSLLGYGSMLAASPLAPEGER